MSSQHFLRNTQWGVLHTYTILDGSTYAITGANLFFSWEHTSFLCLDTLFTWEPFLHNCSFFRFLWCRLVSFGCKFMSFI